jgi:hypothetical protein
MASLRRPSLFEERRSPRQRRAWVKAQTQPFVTTGGGAFPLPLPIGYFPLPTGATTGGGGGGGGGPKSAASACPAFTTLNPDGAFTT